MPKTAGTSKKQVSVLATSVLVTSSGEKVVNVPYIHNLVYFQKSQITALLDSGSEINAISADYDKKLSLDIQKINIEAQDINGSAQKNFKIVITNF